MRPRPSHPRVPTSRPASPHSRTRESPLQSPRVPHESWLELPRRTHVRARITGDGDIHVMVDEVNLLFDPAVLRRVVAVADELLAVPTESRTP